MVSGGQRLERTLISLLTIEESSDVDYQMTLTSASLFTTSVKVWLEVRKGAVLLIFVLAFIFNNHC